MPTWEEMKRAGQTAFIMTGNGFEDMHKSISHAYQQILMTGHLSPNMGGMDRDQNVAMETELEKPQPEHEYGLEPER
jgi:hypothetical protein